ncbi:MAG: cell division protein FtsQ/DivIB [Roseburia sp.]
MIREKRSRMKKVKRFFLGLLIFLLIVAAAALVVIKGFTVEHVEVEGNELYPDSQIESWVLNDEYSSNTLYVYLKYKLFPVQSIPFIDTVEVSLSSPRTVHIQVYEKGMIGYIYMPTMGQNVYFDKDGFVVETSSNTIEGVAEVTGLTCQDATLYEQLELDQKGALKTLLTVTQTLKKYNLEPDAIDYGSQGDITVSYGTITVMLGDTENLTEKVVRLEKIMPNLEGLSGTLHLEDWTEDTTDITFRKDETVESEDAAEPEEAE